MTLWITKSVCTNRDGYSNWSKIALFDAKCSKVHNVFAEKNEVQTKSKVISNIADGVMLCWRVMSRLGIKGIIVTNAAGGLNSNLEVGDVMVCMHMTWKVLA